MQSIANKPTMLSISKLSSVILSVVMLNVVAPFVNLTILCMLNTICHCAMKRSSLQNRTRQLRPKKFYEIDSRVVALMLKSLKVQDCNHFDFDSIRTMPLHSA
jgi:hypothetical protein